MHSQSSLKLEYDQVKLAEMLGKGGPRVRPITPGKYEAAPDAYRASVCCLVRDYSLLLRYPPVNPQNFDSFSPCPLMTQFGNSSYQHSTRRVTQILLGCKRVLRPVWVQLLGEICEMDTPYSGVLRTILETVEQAIYSNYVTPHEGGTFDQVLFLPLPECLEDSL